MNNACQPLAGAIKKALAFLLLLSPAAGADEVFHSEISPEAAWDWRPGDLIFRNGVNSFDEAIKRSFGLEWASVGILRASSGGPRVVFAHQTDGVTEEMLYEHIEGLAPDEYAVYRLRDLDSDRDPDALMGSGPMVRLSLTIAYGAPFDRQFILGDGAFYNAELAYVSALNAGIAAGAPIPIRNLLDSFEDIDPELRDALESHRYCRYAQSFQECWTYDLGSQSIITTDGLIASGVLERVFP